jgi:hypothetical protein
MAYVVGFLSEAEERILKARGWELEPSPRELVPSDPSENPARFRMVWVDASMFDIMNGPDWEKGDGHADRDSH